MKNILIIGFPDAAAVACARAVLGAGDTRVQLLASPARTSDARSTLKDLGGDVELLEGDVAHIDFGLGGDRYTRLAREIDYIINLTAPQPATWKGGDDHAVRTGREVLELAQATPRLKHAIVLSSLDVSGSFAGSFAERDLSIGVGRGGADSYRRQRAERVYRRFGSKVPITVIRTGWLIDEEMSPGTCPVALMSLAVADGAKPPGGRLILTSVDDLIACIVGLLAVPPVDGCRTLHLVSRNGDPQETVDTIVRRSAAVLPAGFDMVGGAKRLLRRKTEFSGWSSRDFFGRRMIRARVETAWTNHFLRDLGVQLPQLHQDMLMKIVDRAVEEIAGFR